MRDGWRTNTDIADKLLEPIPSEHLAKHLLRVMQLILRSAILLPELVVLVPQFRVRQDLVRDCNLLELRVSPQASLKAWHAPSLLHRGRRGSCQDVTGMSDDLASVGRSHLDGQPAIRLLDLLGRTLTVQPQDIVVRHIYWVLVSADTASCGPRGGGRGGAGRWAGRGGLGLRVGEHVFAPGRELGAHRCTSSLEASDTQSADERGWYHVFLGGLASGHVNSCSGCRG